MLPESKLPPEKSATGRLLSIDALRGFVMFWIVGGEDLIKNLATWSWARWGWGREMWSRQFQVTWAEVADTQLKHVDWEGFHFYDLIFPLFLFVVGLVIPFSLGKMQRQGKSRAQIYGRILLRTALLFVFGMLYNGDFRMADVHDWRWPGVLQRLGLCYGCAAVIVLNFRPRWQALVAVVLLLGYWALLGLVPSPVSGEAPDYGKYTSLAGYIDHNYLPGKIYPDIYGYGDNEGYLSTIPAIATALLGALAGQLLASGLVAWRKVGVLVVAGAACLGLGLLWGGVFPVLKDMGAEKFIFPLIKNLWTSSFVLVTGGCSLLLLALFYTVIDWIGLRAWAFFFVVIGSNAITVYLLHDLVDWDRVASFFVGIFAHKYPDFKPVLMPLTVIVLEWLLLLLLYRKRIFLRV